jgi:hypothetical protein
MSTGRRGEYFNLKERKCQKAEEEWADRNVITYIPHEIPIEETSQKRPTWGGEGGYWARYVTRFRGIQSFDRIPCKEKTT